MSNFLYKTLTSILSLLAFCYTVRAVDEKSIVLVPIQTLNIPVSPLLEYEETQKPCCPWFVKERWFVTVDFGIHFKPFLPVEAKLLETKDKQNIFIDKKYGKSYWGESGFLGSYGIAYKRIFEDKKWFWGSRIVWTYFTQTLDGTVKTPF